MACWRGEALLGRPRGGEAAPGGPRRRSSPRFTHFKARAGCSSPLRSPRGVNAAPLLLPDEARASTCGEWILINPGWLCRAAEFHTRTRVSTAGGAAPKGGSRALPSLVPRAVSRGGAPSGPKKEARSAQDSHSELCGFKTRSRKRWKEYSSLGVESAAPREAGSPNT